MFFYQEYFSTIAFFHVFFIFTQLTRIIGLLVGCLQRKTMAAFSRVAHDFVVSAVIFVFGSQGGQSFRPSAINSPFVLAFFFYP